MIPRALQPMARIFRLSNENNRWNSRGSSDLPQAPLHQGTRSEAVAPYRGHHNALLDTRQQSRPSRKRSTAVLCCCTVLCRRINCDKFYSRVRCSTSSEGRALAWRLVIGPSSSGNVPCTRFPDLGEAFLAYCRLLPPLLPTRQALWSCYCTQRQGSRIYVENELSTRQQWCLSLSSSSLTTCR